MPHFEIRLIGNRETGATIDGAVLRDVLDSLLEGVRRAVRLRVEGRSSAPGTAPRWLSEAGKFRVLGFREGSTVIDLDAPVVGEALADRGGLGPLFEEPDPHATGMGWYRDVLEDALRADRDSDRFDAGLLDAVVGWHRVLSHGVARIEFSNGGPSVTSIDAQGLQQAASLIRSTPPPQRVRVAGWLEAIRHSTRAFVLTLADKTEVRGVAPQVPVESLRQLFGRKAYVDGLAHFRPNGHVARLEAEQIAPAGEDFEAWSQAPEPLFGPEVQPAPRVPQGPRSGLNAIFGQWPGDESDEEIEHALKGVS